MGPKVSDPAAHLGLPFDEVDVQADVGEPDGGSEAGDAGSHHHGGGGCLDDERHEVDGVAALSDAGANEADGLFRRARRVIAVRPRSPALGC